MTVRRPARSAALGLVAFVVIVGSASPLAGQDRYEHDAQIAALLARVGSPAELQRSEPAALEALALQLLDRGQFYLDVFELQVRIGLDYARLRDTISVDGGIRLSESVHFLGRHLMEAGDHPEARDHFTRSVDDSGTDEAIRSRSSAWIDALDSPGGDSGWRGTYVRWRRGEEPASVPTCPAGPMESACALFSAVIDGDPMRVLDARRELAQDTVPEFVREITRESQLTVRVGLHDPIGPYLLAAADYSLAATVLRALGTVPEFAALALLRSNRLGAAAELLSGDEGLQAVLQAELAFHDGRTDEAHSLWSRVFEQDAGWSLMALDSRSLLDPEYPWASSTLNRAAGDVVRRDPRQQGQLIRALLRSGRFEEALELSDLTYRGEWEADLDMVMPSILLLRAHAIYGNESAVAERGKEARYFLWSLRDHYPALRPAAVMLDELTNPSRPLGNVR